MRDLVTPAHNDFAWVRLRTSRHQSGEEFEEVGFDLRFERWSELGDGEKVLDVLYYWEGGWPGVGEDGEGEGEGGCWILKDGREGVEDGFGIVLGCDLDGGLVLDVRS